MKTMRKFTFAFFVICLSITFGCSSDREDNDVPNGTLEISGKPLQENEDIPKGVYKIQVMAADSTVYYLLGEIGWHSWVLEEPEGGHIICSGFDFPQSDVSPDVKIGDIIYVKLLRYWSFTGANQYNIVYPILCRVEQVER